MIVLKVKTIKKKKMFCFSLRIGKEEMGLNDSKKTRVGKWKKSFQLQA